MSEQNSTGPGTGEPRLRRQIVTAYAVVAVLVALSALTCSRSPDTANSGPVEIPDSFEAQFAVCLEKLTAEAPADGIDACKRAVELQPENMGARHNLGYAYRLLGDYNAAEAEFLLVVEREPLNSRAAYELASTYMEAGRTDEARTQFEQVLKLNPDHGWAQRRLDELGE